MTVVGLICTGTLCVRTASRMGSPECVEHNGKVRLMHR